MKRSSNRISLWPLFAGNYKSNFVQRKMCTKNLESTILDGKLTINFSVQHRASVLIEGLYNTFLCINEVKRFCIVT